MKPSPPFANIISILATAFLFGLCTASIGATNWVQTVIGRGAYDIEGVVVGDARNDGTQRVYGASTGILIGADTMLEFEFIGGTWHTDVYPSSYVGGKLAIGNCRNDGVLRLFALDQGEIKEWTYSGSAFSLLFVDLGCDGNDVALGQGRNDSANRIYVASTTGTTGFVQELTYKLSGYLLTNIYSAPGGLIAVGVGNGRGDGITRVYSAKAEGDLVELSWSGGQWGSQTIPLGQSVTTIRIGNGRDDPSWHIYVATAGGLVYELTYRLGTWDVATVGYGGMGMQDLAIAAGRNDGVQRVYAANADKHVYEFSYSGTGWTKQDLGGGTASMGTLAVGAGRNDGVNRVYGANGDCNFYEFTYAPSSTNLPPKFISFANGVVTWTNATTNVVCDIEWCPNLSTGIWKGDWSAQSGILVTNPIMSVPVPMFYRVKVRNE